MKLGSPTHVGKPNAAQLVLAEVGPEVRVLRPGDDEELLPVSAFEEDTTKIVSFFPFLVFVPLISMGLL